MYIEDKKHIWQRVATDMKLPNVENYQLNETPEYLDKTLKGLVVGRYVVNVKNV